VGVGVGSGVGLGVVVGEGVAVALDVGVTAGCVVSDPARTGVASRLAGMMAESRDLSPPHPYRARDNIKRTTRVLIKDLVNIGVTPGIKAPYLILIKLRQ
jgi:hypothetical protein